MPPRFHWLRLRATCHPTESPARVQEAVRTVSGLDVDAFPSCLEVTEIPTHHGGTLHLVEATVTQNRAIRDAFAAFAAVWPGLETELDARTDDEGVLYLRFDKQAAFTGDLVPTRGDDAVQVRIRPEVHPAGRERALEALRAAAAD